MADVLLSNVVIKPTGSKGDHQRLVILKRVSLRDPYGWL
jgi:hypothetical protein